MSRFLHNDCSKRPDLFNFNGPIPLSELDRWINERQLNVPNDLKLLWHETGGGELFESETILSPFGDSALADDIESVNHFHREKGMPRDWMVFHIGLGGLTVVQRNLGTYASVSEEYKVQQTFSSLDDWYENLIRKEFAFRYKLDN